MRRNKFSLSHYKLLTMNMGELIPISWYEALPGDTIQQASSLLIRVSPLLSPVMHPVRIRVHHWFVPLRLIWDDFEDFITGGDDGNDTTAHPYIAVGSCTEGQLKDYMGVPVNAGFSPSLQPSALPFRAYSLIYNEHYRDQDLVTAVNVGTGNGADATTSPNTIHKVSWEKDYFTTARPWEQKGTDVNIPLVGDAPVKVDATTGRMGILNSSDTQVDLLANSSDSDYITFGSGGTEQIYADLSAATGVSANDLRLYMALQRYKEARAEFGSRYVEYLQAAFGIRSSDARLQNPEYLGGGRQVMSFSEILSTADSGTDVVGTMRGHGIAAMRTNRFRRFFEEHGIVMSLMSVVPKAIYATGLDKKFIRSSKEEYFQKELAFIGDEVVENQEVYADHSSSQTGTFGYQQRYDSYRRLNSGIAGEFQSSLNHWHYARLFGADPSLNQSFIECDPTKRQYADNASDVLYVMANHSVQARRMIPKYPTKKLI